MDPKSNKGFDVNELADNLEKHQVDIKGYQFNVLQLIVFVGAILQLIASILPMFTVNVWGYSASVSYIQGDGIIALVLVIATCVCVYLNKKPIALGLSVANAALILYDSIIGSANTYGLATLSIGGYLLILIAIVIAGVCALSFVRSRK